MKFSILTPSFNAQPYIAHCIESVRDQNIPDIEHIICDGGSKDGTAEILQQNAAKLAYWVSEPDKGQSDALNKALAKATGEIVGWLNADEFYEPNIFRKVHETFEKNPDAVVVYGDYKRIDEKGNLIRRTSTWRFDYDVCSVITPIIMNCAAFFRRDALIACGGFGVDFRYIMDWDLYLRLLAGDNRKKWIRLRKTLASFTMHPLSKSVSEKSGFDREIAALRKRLFPDKSPDELMALRKKQGSRMKWHMFFDGVLFEKVWFKVFRQRHFPGYFGGPFVHIPILTPLLSWLDPPKAQDPTKPLDGSKH